MKTYLITFSLLFFSCASKPSEPQIQHNERTYRTCTKEETPKWKNSACYRYCYRRWFREKCETLVTPIDERFEDFIIIHRSRIKP